MELESQHWATLVTTLHEAGALAFSGLQLSREEFAAYLHARVSSVEELALAPAEDLYLACACTLQRPMSARYFETRYMGHIRAILSRFDAPGTLLEDTAQSVKGDLLVAAPRSLPKLAQYRGQGELLAFVRVVVTRAVLSRLRSLKDTVPADVALAEVAAEQDTELAYLKRKYRREFREAFTSATRRLESRQRTLLRYQVVDRLSVDQVGAIYSVHRATAARWIGAAREALLEHTRSVLREQLTISGEEFESIMRLIRSDLDVSVARLLDSHGDFE